MPPADRAADSALRDELRTVGFRLRELQRLASMRVQQENRRLAAQGIEPVTEPRFVEREPPSGAPGADATGFLIETLSALDVFEEARIDLADGTSVAGRVNAITYRPADELRLELRPRDEESRYELVATAEDGVWNRPEVRRYHPDDADWAAVGELAAVESLGNAPD